MKYRVYDCEAQSYSSFGDLKSGSTSVVAINDVSSVGDHVARAAAIVAAVNSGVFAKTAEFTMPIRAVHIEGTSSFQLIAVTGDDAGELRYEASPGITGALPNPRVSAAFTMPASIGVVAARNAVDGAFIAAVSMMRGVPIAGLTAAQ